VEVDGQVFSPRAHLVMHEVVAAQLWHGDPPAVWATAERLIADGYERHEILHMLASVATSEIWRVQNEGEPFDAAGYAAALDDLPESWNDQKGENDDDIVERAHQILADNGPLPGDDLFARLSDDFDVDEEEAAEAVGDDPGLVLLAGERIGCASDLIAGTVLTHRVTEAEVEGSLVVTEPDLGPLDRFLDEDGFLYLAGGSELEVFDAKDIGIDDPEEVGEVLVGPTGWLGDVKPGDLLGFRISTSQIEVIPDVAESRVSDLMPAQLRAAFDRFGDGDGMPVAVDELLYEVAAAAPGLVKGAVLPPLGTLVGASGLEISHGYAGPIGADWDRFWGLQRVVGIAADHQLDVEDGQTLVITYELYRQWKEDGTDVEALAGEVDDLLADPDIGEAFTEAVMTDRGEDVLLFVEALKGAGVRRGQGGLSWIEYLAARKTGDLERAEASLRAVLAIDPDHEGALGHLAWYASDRGDARQALQLLERMEDEDEERLALLGRYVAAPKAPVGRNAPCPCGSGRKYKHCCISTADTHPLPERVPWLWEKMGWWLSHSEWEDEVIDLALSMGGDFPTDERKLLALADDLNAAASLVLFQDRAINDFLTQRGPLLPDDERDLATQWASTRGHVHEVVAFDRGKGVRLRDEHTGDVLDVVQRGSLAVGDLVYAHPIYDGSGYQFVGGVSPVPPGFREVLIELIDTDANAAAIAAVLAISDQPPDEFMGQMEERWLGDQ
jgi:tetratricopeptide (TPR) repeat protein